MENMETPDTGHSLPAEMLRMFHDLVDYVTAESLRAGEAAADFARAKKASGRETEVRNGEGVNYTLPQRIRVDSVGKVCEIFFRTNRVRGNSIIEVTSGGTRIAQYKRERMAPGEMEKISLPSVLLAKAGDELTVSVREVSE